MIADNNEKKNTSETSNGKINEQNKQNGQQRRNDSQKNLLIDLSNDPKPTGNSWVSNETRIPLWYVPIICPLKAVWSAK